MGGLVTSAARQTVRSILAWALLVACVGCSSSPRTASLHRVDGVTVISSPVSAAAYEAFMRGELALRATPPDLEAARGHVAHALELDGSAARLWSAMAEIMWRSGDVEEARRALSTALQLDPALPHGRTLLERISTPAP